jgi:hypothetical protein
LRVGVALAIVVAFAGGYAAGHRRTLAWTVGWVTAESSFNLSHRVDTLARLRNGDTAGAIDALEHAVDTAAMNLSGGKPWPELEPDVRSALQLVKAYRSRHPPSKPAPELSALLESIPMPDVRYCSPALQELLGAAERKTGR